MSKEGLRVAIVSGVGDLRYEAKLCDFVIYVFNVMGTCPDCEAVNGKKGSFVLQTRPHEKANVKEQQREEAVGECKCRGLVLIGKQWLSFIALGCDQSATNHKHWGAVFQWIALCSFQNIEDGDAPCRQRHGEAGTLGVERYDRVTRVLPLVWDGLLVPGTIGDRARAIAG